MPSSSLNVIALISGGKDSLFSLLHCIQTGHKIIALANLYPISAQNQDNGKTASDFEGEDLNSFMYQTVGHTIIPLYAEALNVPLYRRQISGRAIHTGREYAFAEGHDGLDETEDLVPLLSMIKTKHPEANAISTGAILSTYQRTRVESVAARLGLTSIAYLWQYPILPPPIERADSITGLLDDMEAAGCDARLIKIASAGIKESLLWSRVSDPSVRSRLVAGMRRYVDDHDEFALRGAVLGEGGEYETLAINGPGPVWKKRIEIDSKSNAILQDEGGATRLSFGKATLVEQAQKPVGGQEPLVRLLTLLDDRFKEVEQRLSKIEDLKMVAFQPCRFPDWICPRLQQNTSQSSTNISINNLVDDNFSNDIAEQTTAIISKLDNLLSSKFSSSNGPPRVVFTTILLRHMSDFAAVNDIYSKRFNHINPPARVTISCGDSLPKDVLVSMSFTITKMDPARISGLHVQSISYWAPANIGPYSQAISIPVSLHDEEEGCREQIVHVAGQIPLLPSSMQILDGSFARQAVLSLQHLWRVGQSVGVDWWTHGIAYLGDIESDDDEIQRRAKVAWEVWRGANTQGMHDEEDEDPVEEDDSLDAWDLKYNHQLHSSQPSRLRPANSHLHTLPNFNVLTQNASSNPPTAPTPPFLAAHISSLPRSAAIEWHSLGLARLPKLPASKPRLSVSVYNNTDPRISISSSTLSLPNPSEAADKDQQGVKAIQFFSIHIFSPSEPSTSASTSSSSPSDDLSSLLQTALSHLSAHNHNHNHNLKHPHNHHSHPASAPPSEKATTIPDPPTTTMMTTTTIYTSSRAAYNAINNTNTNTDLRDTGIIIPCRSLWGEGARRVDVAVVGSREREICEDCRL